MSDSLTDTPFPSAKSWRWRGGLDDSVRACDIRFLHVGAGAVMRLVFELMMTMDMYLFVAGSWLAIWNIWHEQK